MRQRESRFAWRLVLGGLLALSAGSAASAAPNENETVVFGPKKYERTRRSPTLHFDQFSLPPGVSHPFRVRIRNGRADGQDRVESAWLFVNGALVAGPADFDRDRHEFTRPVHLRPKNVIAAVVYGQRGDFFEATFLAQRPKTVPTKLLPDPLSLGVGAFGQLIATLSPPPLGPGLLAARSTRSRIAAVPASVPFVEGQTQVEVPVSALAEGRTRVEVSLNGRSASATVRVTPTVPRVVSLVPPTMALTVGASGTLTVVLSSAPDTATDVAVTSTDAAVAAVPGTVTVPAGQLQAPVPVEAVGPGLAQVTARLNGSSASSQVTVTAAPPTLVSLLPPLVTVTVGAKAALELTISSAQATDTEVAIEGAPAGVVSLPPTVVVPAGRSSTEVPVEALELGQATVTATLNGTTASALVDVVAPPPELVALEPDSVRMTVGSTTGFVVRINAAQSVDTEVTLASSLPAVLEVPASLTVEAGQTSAGFMATALAVGDAMVTASLGSGSRQSSVHVSPQPAAVTALVPSLLPLQEGATGLLTVWINAAQEEDTAITLDNDSPAVAQAPAQVTVRAGELSAEIPVSALSEGEARVTASVNGTSATAVVRVTPPPPVVTGLTPGTLLLAKGRPGTLRVTISRGAAVPVAVALSSSDLTVATVPQEVTVAAGALFADFAVASAATGEATIHASLNGGEATSLVIVSAAEPIALTVLPSAPTIRVGETVPFSATATMTDGSSEDLTTEAAWSTSEPAVASIGSDGVATALTGGESTIGARFTFTPVGGQETTLSGNALLTVEPAARLLLTAPETELTIGQMVRVTITSSPVAPVGGLPVALAATGTGGATFPPSVTIPAGGASAGFDLVATSAGGITLTASAPDRDPGTLGFLVRPVFHVASIVPTSGPVGSSVELIGGGFEASLSGNAVTFPGPGGTFVAAAVLAASPTRITARVPPTAESGPIRVSNPRGIALSPSFTVARDSDFEVVVSPAALTVFAGAVGSAQVQLGSTGALPFTGLVALEVQGLPAGASARFLPAASLSATQTVLLELAATAGATPGSYPLTLTGRFTEAGQPLVRTAPLDLTVESSVGVTGVKGRFVTPEGVGIPGVIVRVELGTGALQTTSDAAGSFQVTGLPAGEVSLKFDATPANPLYPIWPYTMVLPPDQVTVFPDWTISPPPPIERFTPIANGVQEQVITDDRFPGLEIRLPAGASIMGWDGVPKTRIAVEKVDVGRLPVPPPPTPTGATFQLYFGTPMGGIPSTPIPMTLPNDVGAEPGESIDVWFFDGSPMAGSGEWKIAGPAIVTPDGKSARMPPGTGVPRFCGVCGLMCLGKQEPAPEEPPDSCKEGNPVDPSTGQEMPETGGLSCRGLTPIESGTSYNPVDAFNNIGGTVASLGFGWVLDYDIAFLPFVGPQKRLVLPGNKRVNFVDDGSGTYRPFDDPRFDGAEVRATNPTANLWELTFRDGRKWRFAPFPGVPTFIRGGPPTFVTEIVDPRGNVLQVQRQSNGRITSIGTPERGVTMTYGSNGFVSEIRDTADRVMRYTYTADNRLETVADPDDRVTRYSYVGDDEFTVPAVCQPQPSFGKRIKTITYPGRPDPTENSYGPGRRVLRQVGYDGREHRFAYRLTGACVTHASNPNAVCQGAACPEVDSWENFQAGWRIFGGTVIATTVTKPDGRTHTTEFNARGMTTARTDALGQKTSLSLDPANRVVARTDTLGRTWRFVYDAKGNLLEETDPLGRRTRYTYDPKWNEIASRTRFDEANRPQTWQFTYDADQGTLLTTTNPLGETTRFAYTPRGELERITSPLDQVSRLEYEETGDVAKAVDPLGNESEFRHDRAGRRTADREPLGFETSWRYNGIDRVTNLTDPLGRPLRLDYDPAGRLAGVTNARENLIESYGYDSGDRIVTRFDAHGRSTLYDYDAAGRAFRVTDRRGLEATYTYDDRDRVLSIHRPEGVTHFSYDAVGRLTEISEPAGSLAFSYDAVDRVVREVQTTETLQVEVNYAYDALDRRTSRTVSGVPGETTTYVYDAANRLKSISYRGETTTFDYDAAGRLRTKTLPNGIRQETTYDDANRVTAIVYKNPDSSVVEAVSYGYDPNGRRISQTSARPPLADTAFTAEYDAADRLTSLTLTATGQIFDLAYDDNGNLTGKVERGVPANATGYSWDSRNRLTGISGPGLQASFAYDALGRRVAKTVNGQRVDFIYDGLQAIGEITAGQAIGLVTGADLDDVIARYAPAGPRYYLTAALNTVIAQTRADRSLLNTYVYSPYGASSAIGNDEGNPIQFTGRENDGTGLLYYRARYYDPGMRRFLAEDPERFEGGANLFAYVRGDPVGANDPTGACPWCVGALVGGLTDLAIQLAFNGFNLKCVNWTEVAVSAAAGAVGAGIAQKFSKVSTALKGANRPTYRVYKSKAVRVEMHPPGNRYPDWFSYPHWHPDFAGKPWSKMHWPVVEPAVGIPAAAYNAAKDDCECK